MQSSKARSKALPDTFELTKCMKSCKGTGKFDRNMQKVDIGASAIEGRTSLCATNTKANSGRLSEGSAIYVIFMWGNVAHGAAGHFLTLYAFH